MKDRTRAIALLVAGHTAKSVAKIIGVHPNSISQWRRDPKFQAALEAAVERQRNRLEYRLARAADKGITTLVTEMTSAVESKDRIRAASVVVGSHVRAVGNRIKPPAANAGPLISFPPGTKIAIGIPDAAPDVTVSPAPPAAAVAALPPLTLPAAPTSLAQSSRDVPETGAPSTESGTAAAAGEGDQPKEDA